VRPTLEALGRDLEAPRPWKGRALTVINALYLRGGPVALRWLTHWGQRGRDHMIRQISTSKARQITTASLHTAHS